MQAKIWTIQKPTTLLEPKEVLRLQGKPPATPKCFSIRYGETGE